MTKHLVGYFTALISFAVLDGLWLGVVARDLYQSRLGHLLLDQPKWGIAALFYLVHAAGLVIFPLSIALAGGSWVTSALYGAAFGLVVYAAYDLTNLATLRGWPASLTVIDLAWGTASTALATVAAFLAVRAFVS